jgi:hypothetical protein
VVSRAWEREVEAVIAVALRRLGGEVDAPPAPGMLAVTRVSFVGVCPSPAERQRILAEARTHLVSGGTLVVVDHNRPRCFLPAVAAAAGMPPSPPGRSPRGRWRRLAYPTAREVQATGFVVEALRLAAGERVQIVFARRDE